jgi:thiosulfate/3-mercaptopyruvate sulfurtransferase
MTYTTLISTHDLIDYLDHENWAIVDCRFSLLDPESGRAAYLHSHIPSAIYAHLNEDLCGPILPGKTGRHPLPTVGDLAKKFAEWGIGEGVQVVVYDDMSGAFASRLWWSLRWLGHREVAVLDGGWTQWEKEKRPFRIGEESRVPRDFNPQPDPRMIVETEELLRRLDDPELLILDSRIPERYRGEFEPIDPIAGRIPGAVNAPHPDNIGPDCLFLPPDLLRRRYTDLLGNHAASQAVVYCGSGVTAIRNLVAIAHAGLGEAKLYPGSWSEWIIDNDRPIEQG